MLTRIAIFGIILGVDVDLMSTSDVIAQRKTPALFHQNFRERVSFFGSRSSDEQVWSGIEIMIISHRFKYVFVQLPRTGSTAISRELIQSYEGVRVPNVRKQSSYDRFLRAATPEERSYFVFSCIRNPLDRTVSEYLRYKNDHLNEYTDPRKVAQISPIPRYYFLRQFHFVRSRNASFAEFFLKFYHFTYDDASCLSHKKFNYIIRFENIQEDFARVLSLIGIKQTRPLPIVNATQNKERNFLSYYTSETIARAKKVFGPFMMKWGYEIPPEWGEYRPSVLARVELTFLNALRKPYWRMK